MSSQNPRIDSDAAAMAEFKAEGALLLAAEITAERMTKRIESAPAAELFVMSRDEFRELTATLKRVTDTAKDYHLGAADAA